MDGAGAGLAGAGGVLPVGRATLTRDVLAGVTLAALGVPEVLGYARIAGMPVVTGLYTLLLPLAVFAVLGASRHLVVAADSATAALLAGALVRLAAPRSAAYVGLAGLVALLTGGLLLVARLARLASWPTSCPAPCCSASSPGWASRWPSASCRTCSG